VGEQEWGVALRLGQVPSQVSERKIIKRLCSIARKMLNAWPASKKCIWSPLIALMCVFSQPNCCQSCLWFHRLQPFSQAGETLHVTYILYTCYFTHSAFHMVTFCFHMLPYNTLLYTCVTLHVTYFTHATHDLIRLAPLSEGRIEGGTLQCSYHGCVWAWQACVLGWALYQCECTDDFHLILGVNSSIFPSNYLHVMSQTIMCYLHA